jgi:hypothetical protein
VAEVSVIGRNTQGVKVSGGSDGDPLLSGENVAESDDEDSDDEGLADGADEQVENAAEEGEAEANLEDDSED